MGNILYNTDQNNDAFANNVGNNAIIASSHSTRTTTYDTPTTINILKALFESENYSFSSFSSTTHPTIVQAVVNNSEKQEKIMPKTFHSDHGLNDFINSFYRNFSNFLITNDISKTEHDGMIKYEIYSIQSFDSLSSVNSDKHSKTIWLPESMIISEAHRVLSTILYSNDSKTIPADLADYVFVYENVMISLENQDKNLYEEILKISFRLNRIILPPYRLLVIHKSRLLLLERKESKALLTNNASMSILQLIVFHLIKSNIDQTKSENESSLKICTAYDIVQNHQHWPVIETSMGIIVPSHLTHPLKYNRLIQIVKQTIENDMLSIESIPTMETCLKLLKSIFNLVNADQSYIEFVLPSLSKMIQIYDYPLLVALPYDRLILSQFSKIRSVDGRWAQGIVSDGKYYSLSNNPYTSMSELKISRGSVIHLRFNYQSDTIINGSVSSDRNNEFRTTESYHSILETLKNKDTPVKYVSSIECDNGTVQLKFPLEAIKKMLSKGKPICSDVIPKNISSIIVSYFTPSSNWINSSVPSGQLEKQMNTLSLTKATAENTSTFSSFTLINQASISSLLPIDKLKCLNCMSEITDDNLECPQCTQVFCRICIESYYNDQTRSHHCPKCCNQIELSAYRKLSIIAKFEKEGICAFECSNCKRIQEKCRLCLNPSCSTLFCMDCYEILCKKQMSTTEKIDLSQGMKCLRCKTSNTYISSAVIYYINRIREYQEAEQVASKSVALFPSTKWKHEKFVPKTGNLEENYNRCTSTIKFNGDHIHFGDNSKDQPLLQINEPPEYTCPESLQLCYWNDDDEIKRWENDKNIRFFSYNQNSVAAYVPHFSEFSINHNRFRENVLLDEAFLDQTYDYDFTTIDDSGKTFQRGPEPYKRPCGWYRKAIKVLGKFENETWLGTDRNAWPVAYHGTRADNAKAILRNGLLAGGSEAVPIVNGAAYGAGIYLSPNHCYSGSTYYAKPSTVNDRCYQIMFQVRVKSSSIRKHSPDVWVCQNSEDIRPYGILMKETQPTARR